jgi:hypothetical protein
MQFRGSAITRGVCQCKRCEERRLFLESSPVYFKKIVKVRYLTLHICMVANNDHMIELDFLYVSLFVLSRYKSPILVGSFLN